MLNIKFCFTCGESDLCSDIVHFRNIMTKNVENNDSTKEIKTPLKWHKIMASRYLLAKYDYPETSTVNIAM